MGNKEDGDGNCYSFEALPLDSCEGEAQGEATTPESETKGCHFFNRKFMKDFFSSWYRPRWLPGILSRGNKRGNMCEDSGSSCCLRDSEEGQTKDTGRYSSDSSVDGSYLHRGHGFSQVDEQSGRGKRVKGASRGCHSYRQVTAVISSTGTETQVDYCGRANPLAQLTRIPKGGRAAGPGRPVCILNDRGCVLNKATQTKHVSWQCSECSTSSSYESAIIGEAHGIVSDMLADSTLPPHVVSGLRAISNLLKPPENHVTGHKPKVSPLVSLSEASNYGSDSEDLPYTGERPTSLPKRLRRSLPPSLIRRMSTSTWTTTTSATGLPTLETEPCRTRSSSFRHSRDSTPASSPAGSRSNSPSPSSPTAVSLTIPKSRSFSLSNVPTSSNQKRAARERRSLQNVGVSESMGYSPIKEKSSTSISPLAKNEQDGKEGISKDFVGSKEASSASVVGKRFNITSDYESNDSPSSSDHSDHIGTSVEEGVGHVKRGGGPEGLIRRPPNLKLDKDFSSSKERSLRSESETGLKPSSSVSPQCAPAPSHHGSSPAPSSQPPPESQSATTSTDTHSDPPVSHAPSAVTTTTKAKDAPKTGKSHHEEKGSSGATAQQPYDLESYKEHQLLQISELNKWDYPVFDLADYAEHTILSLVTYRLFLETGLFDTFRIPLTEFLNFFHALELGYREKPYHNRIHATDVLHGVYYLTSQPIPGFQTTAMLAQKQGAECSESDGEFEDSGDDPSHDPEVVDTSYGVMARNYPPLELMALYAAAAMHDYDHPGRTNAFLVATNAPLAVLYNDRSVLESHHAASAWRLFLSNPRFNWLKHLDKGEFKRFRFLVIEAILATDLKRHFELLAEFNAKVNDEDAAGIDWTSEADRLMAANIVIKMADINGPAKRKDLHVRWTDRISEEFYEQGDEEQRLGLPISPYMDRNNPQLAKLQESFINHLVAPLCNALGAAGLLPGTWVIDPLHRDEGSSAEEEDSGCKSKDANDDCGGKPEHKHEIHCWLTKHLQDNHEMWVKVLKEEAALKEEEKEKNKSDAVVDEMEPIKEEDTPPDSASSTSREAPRGIPSPNPSPQHQGGHSPQCTEGGHSPQRKKGGQSPQRTQGEHSQKQLKGEHSPQQPNSQLQHKEGGHPPSSQGAQSTTEAPSSHHPPHSAKSHLLTQNSAPQTSALQHLPANQIQTSQSVTDSRGSGQSQAAAAATTAEVVVHHSRDRSDSIDR